MKTFTFSLIFLLLRSAFLFSQPAIQWQNTIGGSFSDLAWSIQQTSDGGYVVGGSSSSNISGDKTENSKGSADFWVVKLDAAGGITWQKTIGGTGGEGIIALQQTSDGGYVLVGRSQSPISGDKTENSPSLDIWVVKLDASGSISWQNTICGDSGDVPWDIRQAPDGGYFVVGTSTSNASCDKSENNYTSEDWWVLKLDAFGNIVWENTIGGTGDDHLTAVSPTPDGGCVLGGYSNSNISGDKTENNIGDWDYWVVKLNSTGGIVWQNTIGGNQYDILNDIQTTSDGGYIIAGHSASGISGDKTESKMGFDDFWIVKLNSTGSILWQNTISSNGGDAAYVVRQTSDGGYMLAGTSDGSISGDKTEAHRGNGDYWMVKIGSTGIVQWDKTVGGSGQDFLHSAQPTSDGGFILGGFSNSGISGDKTEAGLGSYDFWVVKLAPLVLPPCVTISSVAIVNESCAGLHNGSLIITASGTGGSLQYSLNGSAFTPTNTFNNLSPGTYSIVVKQNPASGCAPTTSNTATINAGLPPPVWYRDIDNDGWSDGFSQASCTQPSGFKLPANLLSTSGDCADGNFAIHPGAQEICDGIDNDCDGSIDEGFPNFDNDGMADCVDPDDDNDGDPDVTDCNDFNAAIHQGATEVCNGIDDNCNGSIDEGFPNFDNDGMADCVDPDDDNDGDPDVTDCNDFNAAIHHGATEVCDDGIDNNCDGLIDVFSSLTFQNLLNFFNAAVGNVTITPNPAFSNHIDDSDVNHLEWALVRSDGLTSTQPRSDGLASKNDIITGSAVNLLNDMIQEVINNLKCQDGNPLTIIVPRVIQIFQHSHRSYELNIFPNPNNGLFTLELSAGATSNMAYRVTDLVGRIVLVKTIETGSVQQTVLTDGLPNGLYFLQVLDEGKKVAEKKFVKQ